MNRPIGGGRTQVEVQCRQCGAPVVLDSDVLAMVRRLSSALTDRGEAALGRDEVVCCQAPSCQQAEREDAARRSRREEADVERLLEQVRNGETVRIPAGWIQRRPGDYERVRDAIEHRRRKGEQ